jgi:hypothetical protein
LERGKTPPRDQAVFRSLGTKALLDKKYRFAMTYWVDKYNQGMIVLRDGNKLPEKGNVVNLGDKSQGASKIKIVIQDDRNILVVHNIMFVNTTANGNATSDFLTQARALNLGENVTTESMLESFTPTTTGWLTLHKLYRIGAGCSSAAKRSQMSKMILFCRQQHEATLGANEKHNANEKQKSKFFSRFFSTSCPGGPSRLAPAQQTQKRLGGSKVEQRRKVRARKQRVLLHGVRHPHPGYPPRYHLFLHAYPLLQLGGDAGEIKREKELARGIGFDKLNLAEQPKDDNIKAHWNKLFILARSFPAQYWDKFVKKRVRQGGQRRERRGEQGERRRRQRVCAHAIISFSMLIADAVLVVTTIWR